MSHALYSDSFETVFCEEQTEI